MAEQSVGSSNDRNSSPSDPTQLTTDALQREIAHLSDRVDLKIEGVVDALTARIDAIAIGQASQKTEQHMSSGMVISVVAILLTVSGLVIALIARAP